MATSDLHGVAFPTLDDYHKTSHPITRSLEPGETWRWCYPDELLMEI
jgi:hypothetical protein